MLTLSQSSPFVSLFLLLLLLHQVLPTTSVGAPSCRYHRHCDDADPTTLDFCHPHARLCLNPSVHQSATLIVRNFSSVIRQINARPFPLSQKRAVIDAARRILLQLNPHRSLHLNVLRIDPVALLTNYAASLNANTSNYAFHSRMIDIFQRMNDFHTSYQTPEPLSSSFATLPFSIAVYYKNNSNVSINKTSPNPPPTPLFLAYDLISEDLPSNTTLRRGSTILTYDNLPIRRAVLSAGRRGFAANSAAVLRNGLLDLTFRILLFQPLPPRTNVRVTYRNDDGSRGALTVPWRIIEVRQPDLADRVSRVYAHLRSTRRRTGGDYGDVQRSATESRVRPQVQHVERVSAGNAQQRQKLAVRARFSALFSAEIVRTAVGRIGWLRIDSFDSLEIKAVGTELRRLLEQMPSRGLVVDIRGNGGGTGEMIKAVVELIHGISIQDQVLAVRSTPLVDRLSSNAGSGRSARAGSAFLASFSAAVRSARRLKEDFSGPVTAIYQFAFGRMRRAYFGPVVTVVDGRSYSAGDVYAALMVDKKLSLLVGVDGNVGAGGSSSILYSELAEFVPSTLQGLGGGVDLTSAFARLYRGGRNSGVILEKFGVKPDVRYFYTKNDALQEDCDLLEFLGRLLVTRAGNGRGQ